MPDYVEDVVSAAWERVRESFEDVDGLSGPKTVIPGSITYDKYETVLLVEEGMLGVDILAIPFDEDAAIERKYNVIDGYDGGKLYIRRGLSVDGDGGGVGQTVKPDVRREVTRLKIELDPDFENPELQLKYPLQGYKNDPTGVEKLYATLSGVLDNAGVPRKET